MKDNPLSQSKKSHSRKSRRKPATKRRWIMYGVIVVVLLVVIALYETQQELRRRSTSPSAGDGLTAAKMTQRGRSALVRYYRSHDRPSGWEVGESVAQGDDAAVVVPLHFAPGIRSERHGQAARNGEMTAAIGCPTPRGPWDTLTDLSLELQVHDKTGLIDAFTCARPPANDTVD